MSKVLTADLSGGTYTHGMFQCDSLDVFMGMISCDPLPSRIHLPTVAIRAVGSINDYFEVGSMIIVSQALKLTLESAAVRADFRQLLLTIDDQEYTDQAFFCCHILDCVDCFDHERGVCTYHKKPGFTHYVDAIDRLAIDEDKAAGHQLFRIAKGAEYIVCVSDDLADSLTQMGFSGCKCIAPEEWYFGCV